MKRNFVSIEPDLCKGCRLCIDTCPRDCLEMGSEINKLGYQYARFATYNCTACGQCFYSCPEPGAITVYREEPVPEGAGERGTR
jgi:NAD-dependent dihydropyrimidine dehydrogenase PreA subunit